jgi:hypothetical protein
MQDVGGLWSGLSGVGVGEAVADAVVGVDELLAGGWLDFAA